jgi:energy-coupling factor transporter ATP-binding protein EcfA2
VRTVPNETYDVFISYSRADSRHAAEINSVLRAKGLRSFFDRRDLAPGLPWARALERAINAAKSVIVLIGPHGFGNMQQYERDLAISRQSREPALPVVPVILPGNTTDRPLDFLNVLTWVDFSGVEKVSDAPEELARLLAAVHGTPTTREDMREAICPYRGLNAFREEDAMFFFGRGSADDPKSPIGELVRRIHEHPFVMVVGRSGCGKSSLVYAGLLPALRRDRGQFWNVLSLRPGSAPLWALAAAFNPHAEKEGSAAYAKKITNEADELRAGDPELLSHMIRQELDEAEGKPDRLLLYIDQWEELYAQAPSASDREQAAQHAGDVNRFIDLLLTAARTAPVAVVGTVRADFYDPLIAHPELRALLPTRQVLLGAMPRSDLERAIVEPARKVGLAFEPPGLVQRILDEAGENEGMLPLLEYALKETWRYREGNMITGDSYARSGGVREAIRNTAEREFEALSAEDQQAARRLFLRLVTPGEGQEDTRARAAMPAEPEQRKVVAQFAGPRTRLLVTGLDRAARPTVEVAHEALIRTWPRLREWINANREKLRARAAVLQAKVDWEENGRRDDMLLPPGLQLERARKLLADPGDITINDIKEFVDASERQTRKSAILVVPVALIASLTVWIPVSTVFPAIMSFPYYIGTFSISVAIGFAFVYQRYAGITLRRTILFGVVYAVVNFGSHYLFMTTLAHSGFDAILALRLWLHFFTVVVILGLSAIFVPLMRRISVWLPLLILWEVPAGTLFWLDYIQGCSYKIFEDLPAFWPILRASCPIPAAAIWLFQVGRGATLIRPA